MKTINEVILIEDDKVQVFLSKKFLEKTGVVKAISVYMNGKTAYEAMKQRSDNGEPFPDIIFLDLNMPVWDGWEFYEAFIQLPKSKDVTTYILTSSLSDDDYQKAKEMGLEDRYISKPLSFEMLKAILKVD